MNTGAKRGRWLTFRLALATSMAAVLMAQAHAFQGAGHYDLLLAVLSSGNRPLDDARAIEVFCAQLPDISHELDAITQRLDVLSNPREFQWGARSRCSGPVSKHMVRTHFYLHALTGLDAEKLQASASLMREHLEEKARQAQDAQTRASLYCAVGFADHLIGDTRAHTRLKQSPPCKSPPGLTLYQTGQGHLFDSEKPDFLLARHAKACELTRWDGWLNDVATKIAGDKDNTAAQALIKEIRHWIEEKAWNMDDAKLRTARQTERQLAARLQDHVSGSYRAMLRLPPPSDKLIETQSQTCEQQVTKFFDQEPPVSIDRPSCQQAWDLFLAEAVSSFPYQPPLSCRLQSNEQDRLDPESNQAHR